LKDGYKNHLNDVYFYARHITRYGAAGGFQYHDRTIQQLKNAGNLRQLLRHKKFVFSRMKVISAK